MNFVGRCLILETAGFAALLTTKANVKSFDPVTFNEVVRTRGRALVLFARQWCEQAEDVVQESFLQLAQQSPQPENVVGWLYRTVRNRAMNARRDSTRRSKYEQSAAGRQRWFECNNDDVVDARQIVESLQQLPTADREVVVARIWGGLSFEEIGRLTNTSTSSAHRRYHNGIESLRRTIDTTNITQGHET